MRQPFVTVLLLLAACGGSAGPGQGPSPAGRAAAGAGTVPPAPLDSMSVASDARVDSLGRLAGSFVGEGTSREVHLLSSDTALIGELVRRYRPAVIRRGNLWASLARAKPVRIPVRPAGDDGTAGPTIPEAEAGSPVGRSALAAATIVIRGSRCGPAAAQAEIVVKEPAADSADPSRLIGPVLGSLRTGESGAPEVPARRSDPPAPSAGLVDALIDRTERVMDSIHLADFRSLHLRGPADRRIELNTLADVDAAEVIPFRSGSDGVRYAVSFRRRRITGEADTLLASVVMVWDSAGRWRQFIFRPTLLALRKGAPAPYGALRRTFYWRRLQPVADLGFARDNLWMEQVNARDGSVLWGVVQPEGNVVVAAAAAGCERRKRK